MGKKQKEQTLTIFIGRDIEADYDELFSDKPLSEIKQPKNALYLDSYAQLDELLSPKRMDLLRYLMQTHADEKPESVSQVASGLGRKQEAISRDISYLKLRGMIVLERVKQAVYAKPAYSRIEIKVC